MSINALSSSAPLSKPNHFKVQGKEQQTEFDLNWYDFGARNYDPTIGRWTAVDPMADVLGHLTPYNYVENNPLKFIDPDGMLSTHIDSLGNVVAEYDDGDDGVYVHAEGTTEEDVDQQRKDKKNTGGDGEHIGEIGGEINLDGIYDKLLDVNIARARGIYNPFTFRNLVKNNGEWDYKNRKNTIFGLANDGKTQFSWNGETLESQDIGNHHFGAVGLASGLFNEKVMLKRAGAAQMAAGTSRPEWQIYGDVRVPAYTRTGSLFWTTERQMLPPYGDDPRDQGFIVKGFNYYKNRKKKK